MMRQPLRPCLPPSLKHGTDQGLIYVGETTNYPNHPFFLNHHMATAVAARVIAMAIRYPYFH